MMLARLSRLACGASGISLPMAEALSALLANGVTPSVPSIGSIGEADLIPLAHIAAVLAGDGEAHWNDTVLPATAALARAGIVVPIWGPKDGLALVSSNAASIGPAALLISDTAGALDASLAAAALSFEAFRGSLAPFDPRIALTPARPLAKPKPPPPSSPSSPAVTYPDPAPPAASKTPSASASSPPSTVPPPQPSPTPATSSNSSSTPATTTPPFTSPTPCPTPISTPPP